MILLVFMAEGFEVDRIEHRADSYPEAVLYRRALYLQTGVVKGRDDHGDPVELVMLKLTTVFAPGLGELAEVYDKCDMDDAMNSSHQLGKLAVLEALQTEPPACANCGGTPVTGSTGKAGDSPACEKCLAAYLALPETGA